MITAPSPARPLASVNPATGEPLEQFTPLDPAAVLTAIATADRAQRDWGRRPLAARAAVLHAIGQGLRADAERLAGTITREMGKPIAEARAEIEKCAAACETFSEQGPGWLADVAAPSDSDRSFVAFEPLGLVLAIMPWNYPFWQVVRAAGPALLGGNAVLLKHAPSVTRCALELEAVMERSGLPQGVLTALLITEAQVEPVIADPRVRAVTLTGSDRAGSQVAEVAGRHLKKTVLELGGSDVFIVLEDADLDQAVATGVRARFQNTGQTCIAAKRFLVVEPIAERFERRFRDAVAALRVGDPTSASTEIGPLARADLRDNLDRQVRESVAQGATVRCGGAPAPGPGFFYQPTVVGDVTPAMAVFREETFGPVAAVTRVADEDEAVRLANDSPYGLGGNVWTGDLERGVRIARRLDTGGVFVNGMTHSDPRIPFGGVKRSGYGRELSRFGIHELVNVQTIWLPPTTTG
ncbi:MAG TPA: NAD-dependent succinate-semialdehyde dehydrogenase [Candidatus Micrarchaeia archaeon]|nr:NAD-dependent succinate-semialdehyde dehydrogenase [Candidatus Micrarchaeia archaeon]